VPTAGCQSLPSPATAASVYRPRRPAATLLHRVVREHLETYLATAAGNDEHGHGVPAHVEAAFREYLKCGILAHGFARVYCANCQHDFMVAFSCKGRDLCPSCATRRMVEVSVHLVDQVLPRVQHRQAFQFDQTVGLDDWPQMDQTSGLGDNWD
jgi:hypothetical protein